MFRRKWMRATTFTARRRWRPTWEVGAQLKTKNNGAHSFHFESMNSTESPRSRIAVVLNDVDLLLSQETLLRSATTVT
jgi:hypothetical protein